MWTVPTDEEESQMEKEMRGKKKGRGVDGGHKRERRTEELPWDMLVGHRFDSRGE